VKHGKEQALNSGQLGTQETAPRAHITFIHSKSAASSVKLFTLFFSNW